MTAYARDGVCADFLHVYSHKTMSVAAEFVVSSERTLDARSISTNALTKYVAASLIWLVVAVLHNTIASTPLLCTVDRTRAAAAVCVAPSDTAQSSRGASDGTHY